MLNDNVVTRRSEFLEAAAVVLLALLFLINAYALFTR
jgi:hypothetical protein